MDTLLIFIASLFLFFFDLTAQKSLQGLLTQWKRNTFEAHHFVTFQQPETITSDSEPPSHLSRNDTFHAGIVAAVPVGRVTLWTFNRQC
jgi:hypothetical protein